jgi:hypothetical protein
MIGIVRERNLILALGFVESPGAVVLESTLDDFVDCCTP